MSKAIWVLLIAVALGFGDAVLLKGQIAFEADFDLSAPASFTLPLEADGTKYNVELETYDVIMLSWTLRAPGGAEVVSDRELAPHDGVRGFSFRPESQGIHALELQGSLREYDRRALATGHLKILRNDRRVLTPLWHMLSI